MNTVKKISLITLSLLSLNSMAHATSTYNFEGTIVAYGVDASESPCFAAYYNPNDPYYSFGWHQGGSDKVCNGLKNAYLLGATVEGTASVAESTTYNVIQSIQSRDSRVHGLPYGQ